MHHFSKSVRPLNKQTNNKKSETQKNDWTDEPHNSMMDEVESEMNNKVLDDDKDD